MFCGNCGKEVTPGQKFCIYCGGKVTDHDNAAVPKVNTESNAEKTAAEDAALQVFLAKQELYGMKNSTATLYVIEAVFFGLLTVLFAVGLFLGEDKSLGDSIICLFFVIFNGYATYDRIIELEKFKERKELLTNISEGKKMHNLCPNCKGSDIELSLVASSVISRQANSKMIEKKGIFGLFAHTKIKNGKTVSNNLYDNMCHCKKCGATFKKPIRIFE